MLKRWLKRTWVGFVHPCGLVWFVTVCGAAFGLRVWLSPAQPVPGRDFDAVVTPLIGLALAPFAARCYLSLLNPFEDDGPRRVQRRATLAVLVFIAVCGVDFGGPVTMGAEHGMIVRNFALAFGLILAVPLGIGRWSVLLAAVALMTWVYGTAPPATIPPRWALPLAQMSDTPVTWIASATFLVGFATTLNRRASPRFADRGLRL